MAKKAKIAVPQTPKLYEGLNLQDNGTRHVCLVIDKENRIFKFKEASSNHIVEKGIQHEWASWMAFDEVVEKNPALLTELHQRVFNVADVEGVTRIDKSCAVWAKMAAMAEDRIKGSPGNPVTQNTGNKSRASLDTRIYIAVRTAEKAWPSAPDLKTPQALACLKILRETAVERDGTLSCTEKDLREAVVKRAEEIRTRQDPWRIFQYYRPTLVQAGVLKHD